MSGTYIPPLKFQPILKSVVWGGEKIAPFKGIETDRKQIGESWEISGVPGNESVVANGADAGMTLSGMIEKYGASIVGKNNFEKYGTTFPLLIKIIDAAGNLSLQVHPDDELAKARHNSLGKTEMWYIVDTEPGANICAGLSKEITPEEYVEKVADNTLMDVVAHHDANPGDVFFLPAGRIHAIGAGNLLVEVQETSDVTYRIYDYGRVDAKTGKTRELHVEQAKDAIDYMVYPEYKSAPVALSDGDSELVVCDHFKVYLVNIDGRRRCTPSYDGFCAMTCVEGELTITDATGNTVSFHRGESVLVPASLKEYTISGKGKIVEAINS